MWHPKMQYHAPRDKLSTKDEKAKTVRVGNGENSEFLHSTNSPKRFHEYAFVWTIGVYFSLRNRPHWHRIRIFCRSNLTARLKTED